MSDSTPTATSPETTKTTKTTKVCGLFDAIETGSDCTVTGPQWETPWVRLLHLKTGAEYLYWSDGAVDFVVGWRYAIVMRARGDRVWRMYECERWNQEEALANQEGA